MRACQILHKNIEVWCKLHKYQFVGWVTVTNLVAIMAFGNKFVGNSNGSQNNAIQSYFVNEILFEEILGPFWIYLTAILFHLGACILVCFIAVYRKYHNYLKVGLCIIGTKIISQNLGQIRQQNISGKPNFASSFQQF